MKRNGHPVVGFGQTEGTVSFPATAAVGMTTPWPTVLATSVVSAVTGLVVEEIVQRVRKKRKRR